MTAGFRHVRSVVYRDLDATTCGVPAIGVRDEHAIYRLAVERIGAGEGPTADEIEES